MGRCTSVSLLGGQLQTTEQLTEGAACRASHPRRPWPWGSPARGSPGSCPPQLPCRPRRAELPAGPPPCTPPSRWCCRRTCSPGRDAGGWSGLGAGPGSRWGGHEGQAVLGDGATWMCGLPFPISILQSPGTCGLGDTDWRDSPAPL